MFIACLNPRSEIVIIFLLGVANNFWHLGVGVVTALNKSSDARPCSVYSSNIEAFFDCCPHEVGLAQCMEECPCRSGGYCDYVDRTCRCPPGRTGSLCEETCPVGTYGVNCVHRCTCGDGSHCDAYSGLCRCLPNQSCIRCKGGFYGPTCKLPCPCDLGVTCDPSTGQCNQEPQTSSNTIWTDFSVSEMAAIALGAALVVILVIGGALLIRSCCRQHTSRMLTLTRLPPDEPCRYTVDSDHATVTATKRHSAVFLSSDADASIYWNQRASHFERQLPSIPGEGRLLRPASAQPLMRSRPYERRSMRSERTPRCVSVACGEALEFARDASTENSELPVRPPNVGRLSGSEGNLCLPLRKEAFCCPASASIPDYSRHSRGTKRNGNYDHLTRPISWMSRCSRDSSPETSPDGYHRLETPPGLRAMRGDSTNETAQTSLRHGSSSPDLDFHSLRECDHLPKTQYKSNDFDKAENVASNIGQNDYEEPLRLSDISKDSADSAEGRMGIRVNESGYHGAGSDTSLENMYEVLAVP